MTGPEQLGLRARKKARTRADIQRAAYALIRRHGYAATTMNQVAEAAEVSPSTLFRYFPTKESLVVWDEFDKPILRAFLAQPPQVPPVTAFRAAAASVLTSLPPVQRNELTERLRLVLDLPPVRIALLDVTAGPMRELVTAVARRMRRDTDDLAVRTLVGAMTGAVLAALTVAVEHPNADPAGLIDTALAQLEVGWPI